MTFRTEFLMSVLQAGFHFVTADMDGLWLDNPLEYGHHALHSLPVTKARGWPTLTDH